MCVQTVAAIEMHRLCKSYRGKPAVNGISLSIPAGAVCGILGQNGAGKSTTLKMLLGLISIDSGSAQVLGMDTAKHAHRIRARVGYVPEIHSIYRWMTVTEVISFTHSFYPSWNQRFCAELMELFQLPRKAKVHQLSRGMVAKLSLILALSHEPELLVLDEPMTGLDPIVREEFLSSILMAYKSDGRTILFSTHVIEDMQRMADHIIILADGHLLTFRRVEQLLQNVKRLNVTVAAGIDLPVLGNSVWQTTTDGKRSFTMDGIANQELAEWANLPGVVSIDVQDMTITEIFSDFVKGSASCR